MPRVFPEVRPPPARTTFRFERPAALQDGLKALRDLVCRALQAKDRGDQGIYSAAGTLILTGQTLSDVATLYEAPTRANQLALAQYFAARACQCLDDLQDGVGAPVCGAKLDEVVRADFTTAPVLEEFEPMTSTMEGVGSVELRRDGFSVLRAGRDGQPLLFLDPRRFRPDRLAHLMLIFAYQGFSVLLELALRPAVRSGAVAPQVSQAGLDRIVRCWALSEEALRALEARARAAAEAALRAAAAAEQARVATEAARQARDDAARRAAAEEQATAEAAAGAEVQATRETPPSRSRIQYTHNDLWDRLNKHGGARPLPHVFIEHSYRPSSSNNHVALRRPLPSQAGGSAQLFPDVFATSVVTVTELPPNSQSSHRLALPDQLAALPDLLPPEDGLQGLPEHVDLELQDNPFHFACPVDVDGLTDCQLHVDFTKTRFTAQLIGSPELSDANIQLDMSNYAEHRKEVYRNIMRVFAIHGLALGASTAAPKQQRARGANVKAPKQHPSTFVTRAQNLRNNLNWMIQHYSRRN